MIEEVPRIDITRENRHIAKPDNVLRGAPIILHFSSGGTPFDIPSIANDF